jgi:hypothetical protein
LPRFLCGGFYTRGVIYQYAVAALRLSGTAPEWSARFVSALSSLPALPAAYLLGRRLHGRALGLLLVIALAVSVWEIETARFARMYAPFQSVFLWYVWFFLRYTVDRKRPALIGMVALSILGVMTWEGGALLGIANLLPPLLESSQRRLRGRDCAYLGLMTLLLGILVAATTDLRGAPSAAPPPAPSAHFPASTAALAAYLPHPGWMLALGLVSVPLLLTAVPWLWSLRERWIGAAGLSVALLAAVAHQFVLSASVLLLLLLADVVNPRDLRQPAALPYLALLLYCLGFWVAFGIATHAWTLTTLEVSSLSGRWLGFLEQLTGYPRVFGEVLRPWARTLPYLSLGVALLLGLLSLQALTQSRAQAASTRVLLVLLIVLLLAVGARSPGRVETRYTYFLYPLVMLLCFEALLRLARALTTGQAGWVIGAGLCLLFFCVTEDFRPRHILRIDSRQINFRMGMSAVLAAHYYPRSDYRLVAQWVDGVRRPGDTVMSDVPPVDLYYPATNAVYLPDGDERYDDFVCLRNDTDRWTNLPLIYGADALSRRLAAGRRIILLMYPGDVAPFLADGRARDWTQTVAWTSPDDGVAAIVLSRR